MVACASLLFVLHTLRSIAFMGFSGWVHVTKKLHEAVRVAKSGDLGALKVVTGRAEAEQVFGM